MSDDPIQQPTDAEVDAVLAGHPIFGAAMRGEVQSFGVAPAFGVERDPFDVRDMELAVVRQCGIFRVRTDPSVPPDTVYFEQHGRIVGAIVNLQPAWDPLWREIL
jgi:hypothetical protein